MSNREEQELMMGDGSIDGDDDTRESNINEIVESEDTSTNVEFSVGNSTKNGESSGSRNLTDRLSEIFVEEGDGDLLLQQSDRESNFLRWLQALDFQHIGACRIDERLKPLLKINVSAGVAEDCLLSHLSQVLFIFLIFPNFI